MNMDFRPIDAAFEKAHASYWSSTPVHTSDWTCTNIWGWAPAHGLEWAEACNLLWVRQAVQADEPDSLWSPLGDWHKADWSAIVAAMPPGACWERVPHALSMHLADLFPNRVERLESRGQWEYLYSQQALATLSGRQYMKKRNHLNAYRKKWGLDYRRLTPNDIDALLAFQTAWLKEYSGTGTTDLGGEDEAIRRVLARWEQLPGLAVGALFAENQMVAYAIGEPMDAHAYVVHFEKAMTSFRGAYQAINFCFAGDAASGYELVDREQDLDDPGLRQAKETYFPTDFIIKDTVVFH